MLIFLDRILKSKWFLPSLICVFLLAMTITLYLRAGKDLKVVLFGVEQVLAKKSPYENPTDANRTIFRYAPGITILGYPFLLQSKMTSPYEFDNILPSVFAWYVFIILSLIGSAFLLLKIIPAATQQIQLRNLKLSFLLSLPFIGYELSNSQHKLLALFFVILAVYLFERKKSFLSSISLCLAVTIYVPLVFFMVYFAIRSRGRYLISFISGLILIFFLVPSLIFGFNFNNFLLKEWFEKALRPFFFSNSYIAYIDLRHSSQSMPSAIGRIFVSGYTDNFKFLISPYLVHIIIRIFSYCIIIFSIFAAFKNSRPVSRGLGYSIFLILALILPSYCLYYTWSWLFVIYFAVFNCLSFPEISAAQKKLLLTSTVILFVSSCSIGMSFFLDRSFIFWGTLIFWIGVVIFILKQPHAGKSETSGVR